MRVFQFRIAGVTRTDLERLREHSTSLPVARLGRTNRLTRFFRRLSGLSQLFLYTVLAVGSVYAIQWSAGLSKPSLNLEGTIFTGKNVIALVDTSSSMTGDPERQRKLHQLIDSMASADMAVRTVELGSFGFERTANDPNALSDLEEALLNHPEADSLFVFSDFDDYRNIDLELAYERLRKLLNERGAKLYLGTVNQPPPSGLISIALDSGGDVIVAK